MNFKMHGFYASTKIFSVSEIYKLKQAAGYVSVVPETLAKKVRCHELARAVGQIMNLPVQDGHYKRVEHTWLWTQEPCPIVKIIDVYTPGCLPQVQLIHYVTYSAPHYDNYKIGSDRTDIYHEMVDKLVSIMEKTGTVLHEIR